MLELAAHLKFARVSKLLAELDSRDLAHWRIAYRLGIFGSAKDDHRAGVIAAAAANAGRLAASAQGAKLRGEPWASADFFPKSKPRRSREDRRKEVARNLKSWRRTWGVG